MQVKEISRQLEEVVIKIAGDSGDGVQVAGQQFTLNTALAGNDVGIFPEFPAEIRAPQGTLAGVSGFQIHFGSHTILTPGDEFDVLVAFNAAALKTNLARLKKGGTIITDLSGFDSKNLRLAGYPQNVNPIEDDSLSDYTLLSLDITKLNRECLNGMEMSKGDQDRSRNFYILGFLLWMYHRDLKPTVDALKSLFAKKPQALEANLKAITAGYNLADTMELSAGRAHVNPAGLSPGIYRGITGNKAVALGFITASIRSGLKLFYGSYPITPASDILHELSKYKHYGVITFQAEDEIAAIASCIGASYGGSLAVTGTSGPGMVLKQESLALATMMELPLVVVDVQRGGPSTGLPTKTEQADLMLALFGRHGECPVPVIAAKSPADCFFSAIEAAKIALTHMTPVVLLTDGYLANGAETWKIPDPESIPPIPVSFAELNGHPYQPYARDEKLVRQWALPGTPGLEHRLGGLEKRVSTGEVSYDAMNHEQMVNLRAAKVARIADDLPLLQMESGPERGKVLVLGWGSTWGAIRTAVLELEAEGITISHAHLRHLNPFPKNLGEVLSRFEKVIVPEMNLGQLVRLIRDAFHLDAQRMSKVQGMPFTVTELKAKLKEVANG